VRAIRDLVGHGECIAGLADSYPEGVPMAPRERLEALERSCLEWRFRLRTKVERLRRTHGDFHPFNVLFTDEGTSLAVLDTSRGSEGEPADDVACLAINYLFFGLGLPRATFERTFARLWSAFFEGYGASDDDELFSVLAPFFAFRALVLASPLWYPELPARDRDRVLSFAERALGAPRVDRDAWRWVL
jgi:Ser/Thr protein kinase RdoA (MazF antagonist)